MAATGGSQGTLGFGDRTKWFTRNGYLKDIGELDRTTSGHLVAWLAAAGASVLAGLAGV